jgi:iron complex transport system substrate-binding protein
VIGFSDVQADLARDLIRANLQVLVLNQRSVAEILDVVRMLGRIVGRAERAEALVRGYEAGLAAARRRAATQLARPRVYFEEWPDPLIAGSLWVSELVAAAGGIDVFADRAAAKAARGRTVTPEEVVRAAPDVILASWCGKPFDPASLARRPGFAAVPAVRSGRLHEIDATLILQPGPAALTDGLRELERALRLG